MTEREIAEYRDAHREPTAVFAACPECGKSKSDYLTLLELHDRQGYARTSCFTCCLSDVKRSP